MHTDAQRRLLYDELDRLLSPNARDVLMEMLPSIGWSDVARQGDVTSVRGEMAELRGEMAELRAEMAELRAELKGDMAELRAEMAELRAELKGEMAELRGEFRTIMPKLMAANIASMIGVAGLVMVATQLG